MFGEEIRDEDNPVCNSLGRADHMRSHLGCNAKAKRNQYSHLFTFPFQYSIALSKQNPFNYYYRR